MSENPKLNYEYAGTAGGRHFYEVTSVHSEPEPQVDPYKTPEYLDLMAKADQLLQDMKDHLEKKKDS